MWLCTALWQQLKEGLSGQLLIFGYVSLFPTEERFRLRDVSIVYQTDGFT